jgi:hypothetical protein
MTTQKQDVFGGLAYLSAGIILAFAEMQGYSQFILSFAVPSLVFFICHYVAIRIYLRR